MTIRQSLLAILDLGPCYGHQLRAEFERRTAGTWPLNAGQVYATLDRLERDGLVASGGTDAEGRMLYAITADGRAEARAWLAAPVERPARDELAVKLALALTLPGADVAAIVGAQRAATTAGLAGYRAERAGSLARQLVLDSLVFAAEAELAWLGHCEEAMRRAHPFGLAAEPVRRGRPVRA